VTATERLENLLTGISGLFVLRDTAELKKAMDQLMNSLKEYNIIIGTGILP
jgi:hypothetical protein